MLVNAQIERDAGEGRFEIGAANGLSFLVEASPKLRARVEVGKFSWLILGDERFDTTLKKLVLVVKDAEPQYVFPK